MFLKRELTHGIGPIRWLDNGEMRRRARKYIEDIGIRTLRSVQAEVAMLSGGQRQAIAIARSVHSGARILLLDEPLAAMGAKEGEMILDLIRDLKEEGHSMIVVAHNYVHVLEICDRVNLLQHGRITLDQPRPRRRWRSSRSSSPPSTGSNGAEASAASDLPWRATWLGQAGLRSLETHRGARSSTRGSAPRGPAPFAAAARARRRRGRLAFSSRTSTSTISTSPSCPRCSSARPGVASSSRRRSSPLVEDAVPAAQTRPVQPHDTLDLDGLDLHVVPAFHGVTPEDAYGDGSEARRAAALRRLRPRRRGGGSTTQATRSSRTSSASRWSPSRSRSRCSRSTDGTRSARRAASWATWTRPRRSSSRSRSARGGSCRYHWDGFAGNTVPPESASTPPPGGSASSCPRASRRSTYTTARDGQRGRALLAARCA